MLIAGCDLRVSRRDVAGCSCAAAHLKWRTCRRREEAVLPGRLQDNLALPANTNANTNTASSTPKGPHHGLNDKRGFTSMPYSMYSMPYYHMWL